MQSNHDLDLVKLDEEFNFDWNDYRSIKPARKKIREIEARIEQAVDLTAEFLIHEKQALGSLCYKAAIFYNHIERNPDAAIRMLSRAEIYLNRYLNPGINDRFAYSTAWIGNHFAYSWQQKFSASKNIRDKERAFNYCNWVILNYGNYGKNQDGTFADIESAKLTGFAYCVKGLTEYKSDQLDQAIKDYRYALDLYEKNQLIDDQYARAKNRYAQILMENNNIDEANKMFGEVEKYWSEKSEKENDNIYKARFYSSNVKYMEKMNAENAVLVQKISETVFNKILGNIVKQLTELPPTVREIFIESMVTLLLRGFVPMSGMTVQQHYSAEKILLDQFNTLTHKKDKYQNGRDARYVYQFAREATSAGIIPAYRDKKTGDIHIALVCNQRNQEMYNWSAGYSEAPLPGWRGKLLSAEGRDMHYNRSKLIESAKRTMETILKEAECDWTKVEFDHARFEQGFEADGLLLPEMDKNSFHTGSRELMEEIQLDLSQFPDRKSFLVSHDNTVGISQGDAPGQTSNRSHQYLVFLGDLDHPPEIRPGDDVAIADWVNVSKIRRKNATEYVANEKHLCEYMLRGLEIGLKDLWQYLLQQASMRESLYLYTYTRESFARFSTPENLLLEIEIFCWNHVIDIKGTGISDFLQLLAGNLPDKTYTGKEAQQLLNCMLKAAEYMASQAPVLKPENFIAEMNKILLPLQAETKFYGKSASPFHFQPRKENVEQLLIEESQECRLNEHVNNSV